MHRAAIVTCVLAASCQGGGASFEVQGTAGVATAPAGSVVALWEIKSVEPPYFYKYGEGTRTGSAFSLAWDADPPAEAIDADGFGVAFFVLLPEQTAVADGAYDLFDLQVQGISADTAVVYKTGTAAGPAWVSALPTRFSCVRCVRSQTTAADRFELTPCANVTIGGATAPRCDW
jgi:hypothetical protein